MELTELFDKYQGLDKDILKIDSYELRAYRQNLSINKSRKYKAEAYRFKSKNGNVLVWSEDYSTKGNAKTAASNFLDSVQSFLLNESGYTVIENDGTEKVIDEVI